MQNQYGAAIFRTATKGGQWPVVPVPSEPWHVASNKAASYNLVLGLSSSELNIIVSAAAQSRFVKKDNHIEHNIRH